MQLKIFVLDFDLFDTLCSCIHHDETPPDHYRVIRHLKRHSGMYDVLCALSNRGKSPYN